MNSRHPITIQNQHEAVVHSIILHPKQAISSPYLLYWVNVRKFMTWGANMTYECFSYH